MYKENQVIETYEGEFKTVNIETVATKRNCYLWRFDCRVCKNQSIADDENTIYSCNNCKDFSDKEDKNFYCENYVKDFDYIRKKENKVLKDCTTCKNGYIKDAVYLICDIDGIQNDIVENCKNYEKQEDNYAR